MDNVKEYISKYRKPENILAIILVLIVILISFNYIFKDEKKENKKVSEIKTETIVEKQTLESKIESIINEITKTTSSKVLITYLESEKIIPIYETEQIDNKIDKKIVFEEVSGDKVIAKEGNKFAKIDGIIIVSSGITSEDMKLKIVNAISSITSIPEYKVKIFNK